MELKHKITSNEANQTINQIITNQFSLSTRLFSKLIREHHILLNGTIVDTRNIAYEGDIITIDLNYQEDNSNIIPTKMDLNIIYEDDWLLILNKPAGIAIHPSILHYEDSLSNGIRSYFDSIGLKKKIRPVNRLDSNTSGIVVFAKCEYIQEALIQQMMKKTFQKNYIAFVNGILEEKDGTVCLPIARKKNSIIERCIDFENGQNSITHYKVLKENIDKNISMVECKLETGRTHQIRVHMAAIGHPLIGDSLYGIISDFIDRQALHCYKIQFIHPVSKKIMDFACDVNVNSFWVLPQFI